MDIQAITVSPNTDLSKLSAADLRAHSLDIRQAFESPLWQLIDDHERRAQRELDELNSRAITPAVEEVQRIHQQLIENCAPVFGALTRLYGLQSTVMLTASSDAL